MGVAYRCEVRLRCVFVVWDGDVTLDQWSAHFERLAADPTLASCSRVIADLSNAGGAPSMSDDAIQEMANRWRARAADLGPVEWAIVPNGAWSKARQFEGELEASPAIRTMIFDHAATACIWFGIDRDEARTILRDLRDELRAEGASA